MPEVFLCHRYKDRWGINNIVVEQTASYSYAILLLRGVYCASFLQDICTGLRRISSGLRPFQLTADRSVGPC